jgi:hypothetical protein
VTSGQLHRDWSAAYRLFSHARLELEALFAPAVEGVLSALPEGGPVVGAVDASLLKKWGRKVAGAKWLRDPLGPHFRTQFVWAVRFVQSMLALPEGSGRVRARGVPVGVVPAPPPRAPKRGASQEEKRAYRARQRAEGLSAVVAAQVKRLREGVDAAGGVARVLLVGVDGGHTNRTVFRDPPARTILIGRLRKDAALYAVPAAFPGGRGRRRVYGERLPTPEQLRQDLEVPWQRVQVWAAGKRHRFQVKQIGPVRWKGTGRRDLQLVIIAPLSYRPTQKSRLLYRDPAYLICTEATLPLGRLLQAYVWRWEMEVVFREEKTLLGMGEAQVRTAKSVALVPAFVAAMYAYLHVAAQRAGARGPVLVRPKWQRPRPHARCSTQQLLGLFRAETWAPALGVNSEAFMAPALRTGKPPQIPSAPATAIVHAAA